MKRIAPTLLGLALLLAGCSLPGKPKEASTYFVLTDPGPVLHQVHRHPGVLLLKDMEASVFYQDPRLTYSRAPGTRGHYQFAYWSDKPTERLSWLLRQRLEAAGAFAGVAPLGSSVLGELQLNTRLVDFYHDSATPPGVGLLILDAELVQRQQARLIEHRVFIAQVPVQSYDAEGAAAALGLAANQVIDDMVAWVAATAAEAK